MNTERDQFLTEAMGECWHEISYGNPSNICYKCGKHETYCKNYIFSTWEGFGKLWEWSQTQDWWIEFIDNNGYGNNIHCGFINPNKFADALYEFLKDNSK